jgi:hypothetical protein
MSMPSRFYCRTVFMTVSTNVVRVPALAASCSKPESSPSFQPPMARHPDVVLVTQADHLLEPWRCSRSAAPPPARCPD